MTSGTEAGVLKGGALEILESCLEVAGSNRWLCTIHTIFLGVFQQGAALLLVASDVQSLCLEHAAPSITFPWPHGTSSDPSQTHLFHSQRLERKLLGMGLYYL